MIVGMTTEIAGWRLEAVMIVRGLDEDIKAL